MNCTRCGNAELVLYGGRYYCRGCLGDVVRDPIMREKLGLPKLGGKK